MFVRTVDPPSARAGVVAPQFPDPHVTAVAEHPFVQVVLRNVPLNEPFVHVLVWDTAEHGPVGAEVLYAVPEKPVLTLPQGVPVQPFVQVVAVNDPDRVPFVHVRVSSNEVQAPAGVDEL